MATNKSSSIFPVFSQLHQLHTVTPIRIRTVSRTFAGCLKSGWKIISEKTVLGADKRHRHGTLTLRKGSQVISVPYTATVKLGYQFGKPQSR